MIKVDCVKDFYSLSGKLIFEKGKNYKMNDNSVIECDNYHLHSSEKLQEYFKINRTR